MSLYTDASLIMYPSGYKEDKIYSLKPTDGSGDLTFTRASTATRVNAEGLIETASVLDAELISSTLINSNYDTFNEASASGFHAIYSTSGTQRAATVDEINFVNGKTYQVNIDVSVVSGSAPFLRAREAIATSPTLYSGQLIAGNNLITFTSANTLTGVLEFSSTTVSEYRVSNVSVKEVITLNVPRIDYTGGGCGSLLLEPQRTNLALYSEQLNSGVWTKNDTTITANATTSPDGTTNADTINLSAGTSQKFIAQSYSQNGSYTQSVYLKKGTHSFVQLLTGGDVTKFATFDLINGTSSVTGGTATIQAAANGFYRCTFSYTTSTGTNITIIAVDSLAAARAAATSSTGNFYIYGAQLELGSYVSSYIPTSGTAVTRLADAASKTGISSLIGQTQGTLFVEVNLTHSTVNNEYLIQVRGNNSNRFFIFRNGGTNKIGCYSLVNATQIYTTLTATALTGTIKAAFAYSSGNFAFYVNGVQVGTSSATYTISTALTEFFIDQNNGLENGYHNYNQAILFPTRLTNTQLQSLTSL